MYTAELWCNFTQAAIRKLAVAYHGVFKKMLGFPRNTSNSLLLVYYRVPTFQEILQKRVFSFKNRLNMSNNILISEILSSDNHPLSNLSSRWNLLLH